MTETLRDLQAKLASGQSSSEALTEAALARAEEGEGPRVFTRLHKDRAIASARASDLLRKAGIVRSPIEGLTISVKDLFDVAGEVTLAGSVARDGAAPASQDATIVSRLIAAGAVIVGRTNMTEFAFSGLGLNPHYGTPLNPFDRATGRIPGGSSSGAAVSVTDGMAAGAIGTDTGGSVRIPAALCGIAGFKPTARRVPQAGTLPLSTSLDSIGPLAHSVACCATLDAILAGEPIDVPQARPLRGLRFAVPQTLVLDAMDDAVSSAFTEALMTLSAAGAEIGEIDVPEFGRLDRFSARGTIVAAEAFHWHRDLLDREGARYDPRVKVRIERGRGMEAADYLDLIAARCDWIAAVEARFSSFDAVLMPTVPVIAPKLDDLVADDALYGETNLLILRNPSLINLLDGCALSIPCQAAGEAPVGLTIAAPGGQDRTVLAIGQAVEAALAAA